MHLIVRGKHAHDCTLTSELSNFHQSLDQRWHGWRKLKAPPHDVSQKWALTFKLITTGITSRKRILTSLQT